jgi:hypothetical protein
MRYQSSSAAVMDLIDNHRYESGEAENAVLHVITTMIAGAPMEIRGSTEMVISWWRWNEIYEMSKNRNNTKQMTFAQNNMDNILKDLHR